MFKDLKRHLRKKSAKIFLGAVLGYNLIKFVKKGEISFSSLILSLIGAFIFFLIFSWGFDNPESKGYKKK